MDRVHRCLARGKEEVGRSQSGTWPQTALALSCACLALTLTAVGLAGGDKGLRCRAPCRPGAPVDDLVAPWGAGTFPTVCLEASAVDWASPGGPPTHGWCGPSSEMGMLAGQVGCEALML